VIDCDTHVTEPPDVWTSRLPAKFRDRAPMIVHDEKNGWDVWKIGAAQSMLTVGHTAVAGWPEPFPSAPRTFAEVPLAAHDAKARLDYMDSIGVWAMAIYPNVGGFGNEAFLRLGDPELMLACVQAYNDFQIDWIRPDPRRFIPILATPFWDPVASAREIERSAARGHRGVLFTGEPQRFGFPTLADPHWDPLWAAAQDAGLPISFHIGSGSLTEEFTPERMKNYGMGALNARTTVGLFLENGKQLNDLLFSGVLARFPKLEFVSVESGIGFLPFILEAADYTFNYSQVWRSARSSDEAERVLPPPGVQLLFLRGVRAAEADRADRRRPDPVRDGLSAPGLSVRQRARERSTPASPANRPTCDASCSGRTPRSCTRCRNRTARCRSADDRYRSATDSPIAASAGIPSRSLQKQKPSVVPPTGGRQSLANPISPRARFGEGNRGGGEASRLARWGPAIAGLPSKPSFSCGRAVS